MSYRDEVLLIDVFHGDYAAQNCVRKSAEIAARADAQIAELVAVLQELAECSQYWSDYDVPLGIHDRIMAALAKARGQ